MPPKGVNESSIELTAPQPVAVVDTAKRQEGTTPNLTSLPSMLPPGCMAVNVCETPNLVNAGFPFDSAQMQKPRKTAKIRTIATRIASPCLLSFTMLPKTRHRGDRDEEHSDVLQQVG